MPAPMQGPLGQYGIARSLVQTPGWKALEAEQNEMLPGGGGGGGGFGMSFGGRSTDPFHPDNFPTTLNPMAGPSYGLPSIWNPEFNVADTNKWAAEMAVNKDIPQFMQNTFSDPMALRQGKGVYYMDPTNPANRPSDLTGPLHDAKVKKVSAWRKSRAAAQAANALGGSGSTRARGSRRGGSRPSRPSPGFNYSRRGR